MSSDNAQSVVTYTSISSDLDGPSWGTPLMNVDDDIHIKDDDEDPNKDPREEQEPKDDDEDPEEDPNEEHKPDDKDSDKTEPPTHDQTSFGHKATMIRMRGDIPEEDVPPRRRFAFTAPPPGCDIAKSFVGAARAPRINLRVSYQGQVRRQESKYFYTQLHDAQTDCIDIRLEIDVVRGQRTTYEIELQEVHQAYLSSEAQNRALLARLETLKTHISRMKWQRQSAKDLVVNQMMRINTLEARAHTDTVEDSESSWTEGVVGLSQWLKKMESIFHISGCAIDNQVKFATCTLLGATLTGWNGYVRTLGHEAAYAMT
nr:reverse transcriptase domain-containing protein [Tanacetum cinerariifolium]